MQIRVVISKRRAKKLAAAGIAPFMDTGRWLLSLYSVTDELVVPFSMQQFETMEAALEDGNDKLKVTSADWVDLDEGAVEEYIRSNTRNRWSPSKGP